MDAVNLLQATGAHVLRQNQFGAAIGGPLQRDKTFIYGNYEVQRRGESPFYNSAVLANIKAINEVKAVYGLAPEPPLRRRPAHQRYGQWICAHRPSLQGQRESVRSLLRE